jgi:hypothetical protein
VRACSAVRSGSLRPASRCPAEVDLSALRACCLLRGRLPLFSTKENTRTLCKRSHRPPCLRSLSTLWLPVYCVPRACLGSNQRPVQKIVEGLNGSCKCTECTNLHPVRLFQTCTLNSTEESDRCNFSLIIVNPEKTH